ncbi:GMC family oxidoreductase N-terminal domain-containing protein [Streptomyces cyaneofuscatus]|uniref:GMC family oxidoreductase N-terminal domain-containing protein n=1 Tax=Streptomyces cyaneofuscatus TaxID=66883 RepID=UPI00339E5A35
MPIDWSYALAELLGQMTPSCTNGDCALGVNNGGKHSVDVTYIREAEQIGRVTVATHHNVTSLARAKDGRWEIQVERTDDHGTLVEHKTLLTGALIMAAGSLNTSRLLVCAAATGAIPDMPEQLGYNWGSVASRAWRWES